MSEPTAPQTAAYLPEVKQQYEVLPYPPVDPRDEKKRLAKTWLEDLAMINHYCFAGAQTFQNGFRALVAGGGTGDATIFLAEQLKKTDARIVHCDLSSASIALAKERAAIRKLDNIEWIEDSLLNLSHLGLEKFDYINCSGVLHHLEDPGAGFDALRSVLKPDGAMGIMLYGLYGRTGVYQMQALMKLINQDQPDHHLKIQQAAETLKILPSTNWFKRGESLYNDHRHGDAGIYDLLLHSKDRGYTVGEIFDWMESAGLHVEFTDVGRGKMPYLPKLVATSTSASIIRNIEQLPRRRQYEIAELLGGSVTMHSFYVTPSAESVAPYGDASIIPFYFHEPMDGLSAYKTFNQSGGKPFLLRHSHTGLSLMVNPGRFGPKILRQIDGIKTFSQIFEIVRRDPQVDGNEVPDEVFFNDFKEIYFVLNAIDRLLLKRQ